jgi:hypothetical protein
MKRFNPPPPEKPQDAFLRWVEQRTGLVHAMQTPAALAWLASVWKEEKR